MYENNQVVIAGNIVSKLVYSHSTHGENFYMVNILVKRLSGASDTLPVMLSERLIDIKEVIQGKLMEVSGQMRSYNRQGEYRNHLEVFVFAIELFITSELRAKKTNEIFLNGFICKEPIYRETPLGREITDIVLAVNRSYGNSDYIPCVCWGRNARYVERLGVGKQLSLYGRFQSRNYIKKIEEAKIEKRIAYEVSVTSILEKEENG